MAHLLIICAKRYNGHELWTLLGVLVKRGHTFEVVSQALLIKDELTLRPNNIDRLVWDITQPDVALFDAVCVVSGNMADTEAYWTDLYVARILKEFQAQNKPLSAICCSVPTLAPVARGVWVSFFPLVRSRHRLLDGGAILRNTSLTVDVQHRVITAENQMFSEMWGEEICNMLENLPPQYVMKDSGFTPKGSERRMTGPVRDAIDEARGYKMVLKKDKTTGKRLT